MNRNLFIMDMKRNSPGLIIWTVIISLLITGTMMIYPTFLANQSKIIGMLSIVPKEMLQFKGISDFDDLLSVLGFYTANNVIYMMVLGSIYAIVAGSSVLLREEYNRTAEYLLTRPLTRSDIYFSKALVVFLGVTILNIVTSAAGFLTMTIVSTVPFSVKAFLVLSFSTCLLNLLFGALGLFISVIIKRAKPVTSFTTGLVLVFYFIYTISKIAPGVSFLGYISPFRYVGVDVINPAYSLKPLSLIYFTGLTLFLGLVSWWKYLRKDIYI